MRSADLPSRAGANRPTSAVRGTLVLAGGFEHQLASLVGRGSGARLLAEQPEVAGGSDDAGAVNPHEGTTNKLDQ